MHWSPREKKVEEKVPDDQKNDFLTQSVWPEEELKKHDEISGPLYAVSLFDHALSKSLTTGQITIQVVEATNLPAADYMVRFSAT